jgi:SAM-dependent methyltransferase
MNVSIANLLRPSRRKPKPVAAPEPAPVPVAAAPQQPQPQKPTYELCSDLRAALEREGHSYFHLGETVREDGVSNCRVFADRLVAIKSLPKGGVVAEVGTQTGRFADHIYKTARPSKLHIFDLSLEWFDKSLLVEPLKNGSAQIHVGDSSSLLGEFPDEHFDWIYIDGDHSYEGVQRDIAQAVRKVKRDGILVFNDYAIWSPLEVCNYGVLKAVNDLVNAGEWEFVYLALHPWGYHDVALRRAA